MYLALLKMLYECFLNAVIWYLNVKKDEHVLLKAIGKMNQLKLKVKKTNFFPTEQKQN